MTTQPPPPPPPPPSPPPPSPGTLPLGASPSPGTPPRDASPSAPHLRTRRIITVPPRPARADADATRGPRPFPLLDADDLGWIGDLTDTVVDLAGEPWRVALEAIEAGTWQRADERARDDGSADQLPDREPGTRARTSPRRLNAATSALRRLLAGRPRAADLARNARALLLGAPALDDAARAARIASVASTLAITPAALERVLLADIPRERPIELTRGQPTATEVAALANVGLLQRAVARAHSLQLVVRGDASPLLRGCAARGLIVTAFQRDAARETVLDIVGPLALCHSTAVYGRALGSLVPLLATCETFALTIRAEARGQTYELRVNAPALLPPAAPRAWPLVERLATDLERAAGPLGLHVRRAPPVLAQPTAHGSALACPDLGIELGDRSVWIEIVGFWTPEYLARKLARYRAAGAHEVILCVDTARACDDDDDPPPGACVLRFSRRVHAEPLLQLLGVLAG
ncbi:MAG TPA: DUF790 family protein [Kofleriaceae bacterium]|nr:DUF790 family protein [Kofleriaceae bacterium]